MNSSFRVHPALTAALLLTTILVAGCASSKKTTDVATPLLGPSPAVSYASGSAAAGSGTAAGAASAGGPASQTAVVTVQAGAAGSGVSAASAASPGTAAGSASGTASGSAPRNSERVIYFDYDSFVVRDEARPFIEAHARRLMADRSRRLVIEGHADERGSHEYNLALGQKRADAVARALTLIGASPEQLEAVSFGEERPAVRASREDAWSKNRRAELNDRR